MTDGEKIIYKTIKANMSTFSSTDTVLVKWSDVKNKDIFKKALASLTSKGFISHDISFLSVLISLTAKGKKRIDSGGTF